MLTRDTKAELMLQAIQFSNNQLVQVLSQYGESVLNEEGHVQLQSAIRMLQEVQHNIRFPTKRTK